MKHLLLLFTLIFGIASIAKSQNVTAVCVLPKKIAPLHNYLVEISIRKGANSSAMKIQQFLPSGFIAKEIDCKGVFFTLKKDIVEIKWLTPPSDTVFNIKYEILTPTILRKTLTTQIKIIFLEKNERKYFELHEHVFRRKIIF